MITRKGKGYNRPERGRSYKTSGVEWVFSAIYRGMIECTFGGVCLLVF